MHNQASSMKKRRLVAALATCLVAAAMAGCVDVGDDESDDDPDRDDGSGFQRIPRESGASEVQAALSADKEEGWAGKVFTFDGSNSTSQDDEIVSWRFEFGDGESVEVMAPDEPIVEHNYTSGGLYSVNLTVETEADDNATGDDDSDGNGTSDGGPEGNGTSGDDSGAQDNETGMADGSDPGTATLLVAVHHREEVPETEVSTGLGGGSESDEHSFATNDGASNFTVSLDMQASSSMLIDSTEGTVRVLDPDGQAVAEEAFSMSDGDEENLTLAGDFNTTGDHTLEVELDEGEVTYEGFVVLFYAQDDGAPEDGEQEAED